MAASAEASSLASMLSGRGLTSTSPSPRYDVLVVDDDDALRDEMAGYLADHGFSVHTARDAAEARKQLEASPMDVVVLDVMLPGEDGLSLCQRLNVQGAPAVLMVSAMADSVDRIVGLELGADDYLAKPIVPRELLARVRALLRRRDKNGGAGAGFSFAGFKLDVVRRELRAPDGDVLMLTPGELSLLGAFLENPRRILNRDQLMAMTRGERPTVVDRAIDVQISRLRRKLNAKVDDEVIRTHRGLGYVLACMVVRE
jgi:two-component system OmpR family response regulator